MACIEIDYGNPDQDVITSNDGDKKRPDKSTSIDIRDIPQPALQIEEIAEKEDENTPPPMPPSDKQMKRWRREIDERIRRKN